MTIFVFIIVLILIAAVLLILAVLAQSPKGGMAANFGASNQVMGVRQTADFLEKFTWGAAIVIVTLSVMATMFIPKEDINTSKSKLENNILKQSERTTEFVAPSSKDAKPATEVPAEEAPATEATPKAE